MESGKRIEYIDLMKGICIILVVMNNSGVLAELPDNIRFFDTLAMGRMPLYFLLSGLFFKRYGSFMPFLRRKFKLLVVPILVFGALGGLLIQTVPWTQWSLGNITRPSQWVAYLTSYTNIPLWFLRALFMGSLMMYVLHMLAERGVRGIVAATAISVALSALTIAYATRWLPSESESVHKFVYRIGVFNGAAMLPYLFIGHLAVRLGVLKLDRRMRRVVRMAVLLALCSGVGCAVIDPGTVSWCFLVFDTSVFSIIMCPVLTVLFVWAVAFLLQRLPYVSYMGRYSIVVLVTHYPMLQMLENSGLGVGLSALVTLAAMPCVIWLCVRYIPWACAQHVEKHMR